MEPQQPAYLQEVPYQLHRIHPKPHRPHCLRMEPQQPAYLQEVPYQLHRIQTERNGTAGRASEIVPGQSNMVIRLFRYELSFFFFFFFFFGKRYELSR
jgi:hypothetical protein